MDILFVFIIALISAVLQATIGFGFSIIAMMFFPRMFPYPIAVTLNISIALMNTSYLSILNHKHIKWSTLFPLLVPSLIIGVLFTFFSTSIDSVYMDMLLGCLLILLSIYFILLSDKIKVKPKRSTGALMGSIAGIGNGLFGIGGPPAALYLMPAVEDKREYLATIQCYFALSNLVNLFLRIAMNHYPQSLLVHTLSGWAGVLLGSTIGSLFFKRMKLSLLRRFVYLFVGINGLYLILSSVL